MTAGTVFLPQEVDALGDFILENWQAFVSSQDFLTTNQLKDLRHKLISGNSRQLNRVLQEKE